MAETQKQSLKQLQSTLQSLPVPSLRILRVNQLDAVRLDDELTTLLRVQFNRTFSLFRTNIVDRFKPELELILQFLIFRYSICVDQPSPGNMMQNLRYRNESLFRSPLVSAAMSLPKDTLTTKQKVLYGLFFIGTPWIWARFNRYLIEHQWAAHPETDTRRKVWVWVQRIETVFKTVALINFLSFLLDGKYRSIVDRLLGMRLVYNKPSMTRRISFEYMNRMMVWHGFAELLLFLVPLVDLDRIKSRLTSWLTPNRAKTQSMSDMCMICSAQPINTPFRAQPCGHVYCYVCIQSARMLEKVYRCPRCNEIVSDSVRYYGDHVA
eukprot:GILK01007847.1.p1 GENE.GILK01007847.1~~GILK01007847.1.p1  ORF type:complete len:354 (+),score=46.55 GILK01007847.1:94-1062(+)